jgi:hypothetical protein
VVSQYVFVIAAFDFAQKVRVCVIVFFRACQRTLEAWDAQAEQMPNRVNTGVGKDRSWPNDLYA